MRTESQPNSPAATSSATTASRSGLSASAPARCEKWCMCSSVLGFCVQAQNSTHNMQMPRWQCCQLCSWLDLDARFAARLTPAVSSLIGMQVPGCRGASKQEVQELQQRPHPHLPIAVLTEQLPLPDMRSVPTSALSVTISILNCVNCNSAQAVQSCSGPALRAGKPSEELAGPRPREAAGCRQRVPPLLLLLLAAAQPVGRCPRRRCTVGRRVTLPLLLPGVEVG